MGRGMEAEDLFIIIGSVIIIAGIISLVAGGSMTNAVNRYQQDCIYSTRLITGYKEENTFKACEFPLENGAKGVININILSDMPLEIKVYRDDSLIQSQHVTSPNLITLNVNGPAVYQYILPYLAGGMDQ